MTGRSPVRVWGVVAIVAALALASGVVAVTALVREDDSPRRSTDSNPVVRVADLLRDPSALDEARVTLDDAEVTKRLSDHLAVVDSAALVLRTRRSLRDPREGDIVDVRGRAIFLPTRAFVDELRQKIPGLFDAAGVDAEALAAIELLVVAERIVPSAG